MGSSSSSRLIEVGQSLLFVGRPDPPGRTSTSSDPNKGEGGMDRGRIDQQVKRVSRTNRVAVCLRSGGRRTRVVPRSHRHGTGEQRYRQSNAKLKQISRNPYASHNILPSNI
jgi:hypothetical protein